MECIYKIVELFRRWEQMGECINPWILKSAMWNSQESYTTNYWLYSKIGKWFTMMEWKPDLVGAIQECFIVFYLPLAWCFNMPLNSNHQHPPPIPFSFLYLHRVHCPLTAQLLRCHWLCVQMEIDWINIVTYECWRIPHLYCLTMTNRNILTP